MITGNLEFAAPAMVGDRGADRRDHVDRLFRQHSTWLNGWLRRQPKAIESAEDLASEVFLRILTLPGVTELREPRAMMTTIARRLIYELRRRNDLWRAYEAELLALPVGLAASPEELVIVREGLAAVDKILADMPPKARAAFFYSQIDGLKSAEIARLLKVSDSMVRRYIAQGLRRACAYQMGLPF